MRHDPETGCWLWTGPIRGNGYGGFYAGGQAFYAHRWAYEQRYGPPGALHVLHRCDTPLCVKPAHLFLGDRSDNMRDAEAKGRGGDRRNFGTKNGRAKLTDMQVREIRRRYFNARISQGQLAKEYGVSQASISALVRRQTWV